MFAREKEEENKKIAAEEKEFQRQRRNRERKLILIEVNRIYIFPLFQPIDPNGKDSIFLP